jgi:hypothetical protein
MWELNCYAATAAANDDDNKDDNDNDNACVLMR